MHSPCSAYGFPCACSIWGGHKPFLQVLWASLFSVRSPRLQHAALGQSKAKPSQAVCLYCSTAKGSQLGPPWIRCWTNKHQSERGSLPPCNLSSDKVFEKPSKTDSAIQLLVIHCCWLLGYIPFHSSLGQGAFPGVVLISTGLTERCHGQARSRIQSSMKPAFFWALPSVTPHMRTDVQWSRWMTWACEEQT